MFKPWTLQHIHSLHYIPKMVRYIPKMVNLTMKIQREHVCPTGSIYKSSWWHTCVNVTEDEVQGIENFVSIAYKEQGMQYFALFKVLILQILSTFI